MTHIQEGVMDDTLARRFFLQPRTPVQRLYEALHAVFVDGCRQKDAAQRFGLSYAAFRRQVHQFRVGCAAGQPPPFLPHARVGDPEPARGFQDSRSTLPSLTAVPGTWRRALLSRPASRACSSSCLCWHESSSTNSSAKRAIRARK